MFRSRVPRVTHRIEALQGEVGKHLSHRAEEVGRRLDSVASGVAGMGKGVVSNLPAEAVSELVRGGSSFLRAAAAVLIFGGILIGLSTQLGPNTYLGFLAPHKAKLIAAESGLFGILVVELLAKSVSKYLTARDAQHVAFALRVSLRAAGYTILVVSIVSLLSASPALAVGVGSVTGLIIGLSAQATVGNAIAGMVIAISRPFRIGDEITVMGVTGRVVEVATMYTVLDTDERTVLVPSTTIMTQVVQRKKRDNGSSAAAGPAVAPGDGAGDRSGRAN
ncbi:MAG: mechanosensitive ion channel family protein [Chloroflexi bacterium]|nr:mechanosensitive ion channel family protein [Chloroflexota bacterium]